MARPFQSGPVAVGLRMVGRVGACGYLKTRVCRLRGILRCCNLSRVVLSVRRVCGEAERGENASGVIAGL